MERRYFVTVIAPDRRALLRLRAYDLDLFQPTAKVTDKREVVLSPSRDLSSPVTYQKTAKVSEKREFVIDGLLSLQEIGRLVDDGYAVLVQENDSKRSRAQTEVIGFQEWLKAMEG